MEEALGKEHYLSLFDRFEKNGAGTGPSWVREVRRSAMSRFAELGFPSTRNEDWKYTSVTSLAQVPFETKIPPAGPLTGDVVAPLSFTAPAYNRIVFVNGVFSPELSAMRGIASGIQVRSLAEALRDDAGKIEPYLGRHARYQDHSFVALNTAFIEDGAFVFVPEGQVLEEPLYLVFVSTADGKPMVCHPRNLLVLGNASQTRIVESYVGMGSGIYFANAVTEIVAGDGAVLDHYRLQRETEHGFHVGALAIHLSGHSNFTTHSLTLGGSLVRNDVHAVLDGEGIECVLNGLYMVDGRRHVDNHTHIEHMGPRSSSRELYKGVLDGKARGVFNGKILVHKGAQKTDAKQTNRNLLLSPDAVVNTKPQLEIYADDVKCAHGSTIGQLDRDALFYLQSRGIDEESARSLLCYAFASDIVRRIKVGPMRARLDQYLTSKFRRN